MVFGTISYFRPTGTLEMPFGTPEIPWPPSCGRCFTSVYMVFAGVYQRGVGPFVGSGV